MTRNTTSRRTSWLGLSLAGCALALSALPTAGFALGAFESERRSVGGDRPTIFTPASVDPRMARFVAERSTGRLKRFTPAGIDSRASRTLTVAVRVDAEDVRAVQVRSAIRAAQDKAIDAGDGISIASTRYNLGLARDYQTFAQSAPRAIGSTALSSAAIPDLAEFRPSRGVAETESRFAARIAAEERRPGPASGIPASSRITDPVAADPIVDFAGSYRLTRNLDVTAGVRYSQDRARLTPLPQEAEKDSQAVYIGTQFRF